MKAYRRTVLPEYPGPFDPHALAREEASDIPGEDDAILHGVRHNESLSARGRA